MYAAIFDKPEGQNWLKQWRAVYITRTALLPTVSSEASNFHGYLSQRAQIQSISACTKCTSRDVQTRVASCPFHKCFRDELVNEHAYGSRDGQRALTLKNTKAENWAHSPWEIAKVYMPPSGYQNKTTVEETDFNGVAGFIINCKRFRGNIKESICEKLKTTDLSKDDNAHKYICHEFHDEFQQRLDDIEMKLHSNKFDTQTAKDIIRTEVDKIQKNLELLWEGLNVFSDDLSKIKNDNLLSINEGRKRAMDRITFLERRATERIERSVADGKITVETHAAEERSKATEIIEQSVTEGQRTLETLVKEQRTRVTEYIVKSVEKGQIALEDQTDVLVQRLRKEGVQNLQQRKLG
ncbi:hypothetical protein MAR_007049 [Mya arenaria]|uniref:Uncharacterized protein n=1 Tax=Mya arenaria TaxID=6604 RepID=A0ABY7DBC1_MYAAR|nr:hypothetical protein MAR_007049 [Mya arenaria]